MKTIPTGLNTGSRKNRPHRTGDLTVKTRGAFSVIIMICNNFYSILQRILIIPPLKIFERTILKRTYRTQRSDEIRTVRTSAGK